MDYTKESVALHRRGVELAQSVRWNGLAILEIAGDALEDANFHAEAALVRQMMDREDIRFCNHCHEPLIGLIRIHHHTEDGKDVTGL